MKMCRVIFILPEIAAFLIAAFLLAARIEAQSLPEAPAPSHAIRPSASQTQPGYERPTREMRFRNYLFDSVGPYAIVGSALVAGINQADNTPPEWKQGAEGYGKRFISDFGIAAISTTTRYALAEVFHEDTLYYRCTCKGFFPRLSHAAFSTLTSRRGDEGRRVFSFPALVAPYAGTMTSVYAWFPERYGAKDGFRMGNYALLGSVGANFALEFFPSGPHSFLTRLHLNNGHGAANPEPTPAAKEK